MTQSVPHRRTVPIGSPEAVEIVRLSALVGERLQGRFDEINVTMNRAIEESIDDLDEPEMTDMLHASVEGNIAMILQILRNDIPLDHLQPPTTATEYAIRLAQRGVPAAALRRAYHFGSDDLLAQMFEEVRELDIAPDERLRLLHHLAGWTHSYVDWITRAVLVAYDDEHRQIAERSATIASSLVRGVLAGGGAVPPDFTQHTGYGLRQHHVALIAWMHGANVGVDQTPTLQSLSAEMAEALGMRSMLFSAVDRATAWVWLGHEEGHPPDLAGVSGLLSTVPDVRLAVGRSAGGVEGFRRSHAEASRARSVASIARTDRQFFAHADRGVAVASMLVHDLPRLSEWVSDVLGDLAAPTEGAKRMRETLRVFLQEQGNFQASADRLMLHRNSVRYRVQRAIAARGRPLDCDRLDVELALEVSDLLGRTVLRA